MDTQINAVYGTDSTDWQLAESMASMTRACMVSSTLAKDMRWVLGSSDVFPFLLIRSAVSGGEGAVQAVH